MNKHNLIIGISTLVLGILLSLFVLYTPVPNSYDDTEFNVTHALEYISQISQDQHSVYDPENHETVRLYLKNQLEEFLGEANVFEMDYPGIDTGDDIDYDIHNLLGVIPGENETGILLVAHYDSRGHVGGEGVLGESYGAADDGYGLAVLLETARLFADKELTNSIYILMTDGEETGLYGAAMAVTEQDLMDKIGFVINVEARGVSGPAIMFETSTNNDRVIDFYKNSEMQVSYSLATAVYTVMPNNTDFSEFIDPDVDKQGINFAVLGDYYYYHTPFDNYTNVNISSLQHYGTQIIPLVEEFTSNDVYSDVNYFVGNQNQVFFNVFPNIFITYTETFANVLNIILLVLFSVIVGWMFFKKAFKTKQILWSALYVFGALIVVSFAALFYSKFVAFAGSVSWDVTYVRMQGSELPTLISLVFFTALLGFLYFRFIKKESYRNAILVIGIFLNLILSLATGFILSGASFLFMIPAFGGIIALALSLFNKKVWVKHVVLGFILIFSLLVLLPILNLLFQALTIGGLVALAAILTFYLMVLIPSFGMQIGNQ
ncbi:MAG: M28 family peptidase [Bacilli bacterium]|nr:M28 family peptidase [Bacilli bacterium]MBN2876166.1 M28 family peptidase [Bacilli bacterium]